MSLINFTVKHGRTLEEARDQLAVVVQEVHTQFGPLIQRTEWADDRTAVWMSGRGFEVAMRVDADTVYVTGDIPLLGQLLGGPLSTGIKRIVEQSFPKRLT